MSRPANIRIAPSLLDADFTHLADEIAEVEAAGADVLHLDIMDGHFVPNLSFGVPVVADIARVTRSLLDTHLMITDPGQYAEPFVKAGAGSITFHIEAVSEPRAMIRRLRDLGVRVGVSLNPGTLVESLFDIVSEVDLVLVMTVWPGFGGQKLIVDCLEKVRKLAPRMRPEQWLQVDGGVNEETAAQAVAAGANTLVAGSAIFSRDGAGAAFKRLRVAAAGAWSGTEQQR